MTQRHYIAVAKMIADEIENAAQQIELLIESPTGGGWGTETEEYVRGRAAGVAWTARELADLFAADNPRFDRQRFYFACALDEQGRVP